MSALHYHGTDGYEYSREYQLLDSQFTEPRTTFRVEITWWDTTKDIRWVEMPPIVAHMGRIPNFQGFPRRRWSLGTIRLNVSTGVCYLILAPMSNPFPSIWSTCHEYSDFQKQQNDTFNGPCLYLVRHRSILGEDRLPALCMMKVARWPSDLPNMYSESEAYKQLRGLGSAPTLLCHVTVGGQVIGHVIEYRPSATYWSASTAADEDNSSQSDDEIDHLPDQSSSRQSEIAG
ncbi:hypothetical protein F4778DRAFT_791397 [Xylariomycetidae sp. FL2044]|nr:hypothetical protein F4778DRAFT_791397 [Xylariomycetidae sp. FL2044]